MMKHIQGLAPLWVENRGIFELNFREVKNNMNKRQVKKKLNYEWQCEAICGRVTSYSEFRKTLRSEHENLIQKDKIYNRIKSHNVSEIHYKN